MQVSLKSSFYLSVKEKSHFVFGEVQKWKKKEERKKIKFFVLNEKKDPLGRKFFLQNQQQQEEEVEEEKNILCVIENVSLIFPCFKVMGKLEIE